MFERNESPHFHHLRADFLFAVGVLILLYVGYVVRNVLLLIYVSALFAVVLIPAIRWVQKLRIGKWSPNTGLSIVIILLMVLGAVSLFVIFAFPPIFRDLKALAENWPAKMATLTERMHRLPFMENFEFSRLQQNAAGMLGGAFGFVKNLAGGVLAFFSWIILTAYFILDGHRAFHWILSMFPGGQRERLESTMRRCEQRMRNWLVGQMLLMVILGTFSAIVFGLMQLKYFYALAVITGLANIIPIVGPLFALVVVCLVALVDSPVKMLGVIGFFLLYQQLETAFLTPRIMRTTVDLPALAVIVALSLGGALAGVLGALVAVPTAAICAVLIDEYMVKKDVVAEQGQQLL